MPYSVKRRRRWLLLLGALGMGGVSAIVLAYERIFPTLNAQAGMAYSQGQWDRAGDLAHRRLKAVPDDPFAMRLAARAAARADQDQRALALYRRVDAANQEAEDLFLFGRALLRTGQTDPAFKKYQSALERDPDHPEALAALVALYARNDRYQTAEELAERLARQPGSEAQALFLLSGIRSELHDHAGTVMALRRALELDPEGRTVAPIQVASFQKLLAGSLLKTGQPAEASEILESLPRAGKDAEAYWLLSRSFIQREAWEQAAAAIPKGASYRLEHPIEPEPAPYIGTARCADCHREVARTVRASRHATTFARAGDLKDIAWPREPLQDPGDPRVTHRFRPEGDSVVVETRASEHVFHAVIEYAFGSRDHLMTFVGRDDPGGSVMIRVSPYHSPRGSGWDVATGLPRRPAKEAEYLGLSMLQGDGVRRCLTCHTTDPHAIVHNTGPAARDPSIGCEGCHGPGGNHVATAQADFTDSAIVARAKEPPSVSDRICAKCHGGRASLAPDLPRTDPSLLRFQSLTMTWSRCYIESAGAMGCVTCHDPHRNAETSIVRNETKCLACHRSGRTSAPAPARGQPAPGVCPVDASKGCVGCHMPRIWSESTHSFKTDHFIRIRESVSTLSGAPAVH